MDENKVSDFSLITLQDLSSMSLPVMLRLNTWLTFRGLDNIGRLYSCSWLNKSMSFHVFPAFSYLSCHLSVFLDWNCVLLLSIFQLLEGSFTSQVSHEVDGLIFQPCGVSLHLRMTVCHFSKPCCHRLIVRHGFFFLQAPTLSIGQLVTTARRLSLSISVLPSVIVKETTLLHEFT